MAKYRLTINAVGQKAGSLVDLDADHPLVAGGFAVRPGGSKAAPAPKPVAAPAPVEEPVVEEAVVEEAPEESTDEKSSSRRRRGPDSE